MKLKLRYHLLLIAVVFAIPANAQWTYACNDTLTYHEHTNGELMVQPSTNILYSMQKNFATNQFRIDKLENDTWNNVLTGTNGLDFVVTDDSVFVLRKVSNHFVLETYDLNASPGDAYTTAFSPLTAQFQNAEIYLGAGDTVYVHFIDPGFTNGGSVFRFESGSWTDLSSGRFTKFALDNDNRPVGVNTHYVPSPLPAQTVFTFRRYDQTAATWDTIGETQNNIFNPIHDFVVADNDSIYLTVLRGLSYTEIHLCAIKDNNTVIKDTVIYAVSETGVSGKLVEDKEGNLIYVISNTELGPWGYVFCFKWNMAADSWAPNSNLYMATDQFGTEYNPQNAKVWDVAVDAYNTYFVTHSFSTDAFMQNGPDTTHTHVRKYLNCLYLANVNEVDTLNGQLVAHAGPIYTFQWIDCATGTAIPNATDSVLTIPGNGNYAVVISNGECTDTSACFEIAGLGLNGLDWNEIQAYPNPANELLHVTLPKGNFNYRVTALTGQEIEAGMLKEHTDLNIAGLSEGCYLLQLTGENGETGSIRFCVSR